MSNLCLAGLIIGGYFIGIIATAAICAATDVDQGDAYGMAALWPITLLAALAWGLTVLPATALIDLIYSLQCRGDRKSRAENDDTHYDM